MILSPKEISEKTGISFLTSVQKENDIVLVIDVDNILHLKHYDIITNTITDIEETFVDGTELVQYLRCVISDNAINYILVKCAKYLISEMYKLELIDLKRLI